MRVLQLIPELETGGAERTTIDIAIALVEARKGAWVVSEGGRMVQELPAEAHHRTLPVKSKNPLVILANAVRIARLCRRENISIIHARSRAPAWSGLIAAHLVGARFVTTYHGAYRGQNAAKRWYNSVMARGDAVVANSKFTEASIAKVYPFARSQLVTIPRGTDLGQFDGHAKPYDWRLPANARTIVQIARLTEWKGQAVAIEALQLLDENTHLVLCGDDQGRAGYKKTLEERAERHGLTDRVHFVGHADPARALASADVCIVPSIRPEAFGRAAVEAQAAGVPVVVSQLGAVGETVMAPPNVPETARTGWHVTANDASALAQGITEALTLAPAARDAHVKRASEHARRHFSLSAMRSATLAVYERLAASGS
ncbi:MAG: glycosyltransferase family 4 protein [Pseudomonadota bacterium]